MSGEVPTSTAGQPAVLGRRPIAKLVRFVVAGLPTFVVAVPLNWFLVGKMGLPKSGTYACVLAIQTSVNFFICRRFVFQEERRRTALSRFLPFVGIMFLFRAADWAVYSLLVSYFGFWYLVVQLGNAVVFSCLKFAFARKAMEN